MILLLSYARLRYQSSMWCTHAYKIKNRKASDSTSLPPEEICSTKNSSPSSKSVAENRKSQNFFSRNTKNCGSSLIFPSFSFCRFTVK